MMMVVVKAEQSSKEAGWRQEYHRGRGESHGMDAGGVG